MSIFFRAFIRGTWFMLHILLGACLSVPLQIWHWYAPERAETPRNRVVKWWFAGITRILHLHIQAHGNIAPPPVLHVVNHITWLDIVVLAAQAPGSFVSKQEVRAWPVVGFLCDTADTVFIRRGDHTSTQEAVNRISDALQRGRSVFVFPEGTSTEGITVKPFKRRLYQAAVQSKCKIQAISLRYFDERGEVHPKVPFVGEESILTNFLRILREPKMRVTIEYCTPLTVPDHPAGNPRQIERALAEQTHAQVLACLKMRMK